MGKLSQDLTGLKVNRLFVIERSEKKTGREYLWRCLCDCGNECYARGAYLKNGKQFSCGCYRRENASKRAKEKLGKGWEQPCKHCGKIFHSVSNKQIYCSPECSFLDRLEEKESGCWEWQGNCNNSGYGVLRGNDKKMRAVHRFSYEYFKGPIPKGMVVCHSCDNPKCANPDHLFLGTRYLNNRDRSLKGRSGKRTYTNEERQRYSEMFSGSNNKFAKLTEEKVKEILLDNTSTNAELARKYNVSPSAIYGVKTRRNWKHVKV